MPQVAGGLRRPVFILALTTSALIVLVELGLAAFLLEDSSSSFPTSTELAEMGIDAAEVVSMPSSDRPPGIGITYLAFIDGWVTFALALMALPFVTSSRIVGRFQGLITLVVSLLWLLGGMLAALAAIATLMLMIGLFVSAPFGTIAYLALWGGFPRGNAAVILGLLLFLKLCFGTLLIASQPRFLMAKSLMALVALSFVLQLVLVFIHGLLPRPIVAIGDQAWAIVTVVVGIAWALGMAIASVPAVVKAIRATTET